MEPETRDKVTEIVQRLDDGVVPIRIDPIESLKQTIFEFFSIRLRKINESDHLKRLVEETIIQKIQNGDFSTSQLLALYRQIGADMTFATESLLSVFRPNREGVSPLFDREHDDSSKEDQELQEAFSHYTPEELKRIDNLMKFIRALPGDELNQK